MVPVNSAKQRYYEALDRKNSAERVLERHLHTGGDTVEERLSRPQADGDEFRSLDMVYQELGLKAYVAVTNCLDFLGRLGTGEAARQVNSALKDELRNAVATVNRLVAELQAVRERLDSTESRLAAIEAGVKRIDRFTLEAFRELEDLRREAGQSREGAIPFERGRLAKEEAARLALEAGRRMHEEGKRLSLAAVAREAGLKYGQIVYAFGNKETFFSELERVLAEATDIEGRAV